MERLRPLDLDRLGFYPRSFVDLLRGAPGVRGLYARPPVPFPADDAPPGVPAAGDRRALFDEILAESERAGASRAALAAGDALRDGRALAVVTGQQPAILGGALLTLYKVATACALARIATERLGVPAVAIYWNGADDVDRGEIASSSLVDAGGILHRFTLPDGTPPPRTMVGTVAPGAYDAAVASVLAGAAGAPGERVVREAVTSARARSKDLGEFASALVLALLDGSPLLVLDARSRTLRRAGGELFRRYAKSRVEIERAVNARGDEMAHAGLPRPISTESASLCLFATPGIERVRLSDEEAVATMERLAAEDPAALSPNVVLRPVLQEHLFPDCAFVAGPGEAAYLAQIAPAFDLLGVRPPRVYPRLLATIVPEEARVLAVRSGLPIEAVLADPDAARRASRPARTTDGFERASARLAEDVRRGIEAVEEEARRIDPSLPQLVNASRRNIEARLERIRNGVLARIAAHEESRLPGLKVLRDFVRPRGKPQEREINMLELPLLLGDGWHERLDEAAARHARDLEAGAPAHYAFLSGPLSPRSRIREATDE